MQPHPLFGSHYVTNDKAKTSFASTEMKCFSGETNIKTTDLAFFLCEIYKKRGELVRFLGEANPKPREADAKSSEADAKPREADAKPREAAPK